MDIEEILNIIENLLEVDKNRPQNEIGYFNSEEEMSTENELVRKMFYGLKRENKNKVLRYLAIVLKEQNITYRT